MDRSLYKEARLKQYISHIRQTATNTILTTIVEACASIAEKGSFTTPEAENPEVPDQNWNHPATGKGVPKRVITPIEVPELLKEQALPSRVTPSTDTEAPTREPLKNAHARTKTHK
jgi:hypothetical protein